MKDLFLQERSKLDDFNNKLDQKKLKYEDVRLISKDYSGVLDQITLVTKVSDRLQRKLAEANNEIRSKNEEIKAKNEELEETLINLAKAKLGKKASSVMLSVGLLLLVLEEYLLDDYLNTINMGFIIDLSIKVMIAVGMKLLESRLENYFMTREKKKIIRDRERVEVSKKLKPSLNDLSLAELERT
jgi:F0F1-type ATP synthase assembly protein I